MPLLQINFKLNVPAADYTATCHAVAGAIAAVTGLRWKIWILNEHQQEAGGIYCFATQQDLNNYLSGPIVSQLRNYPAIRDISAKQFDVMEDLTAITRGPVAAEAAAT